ncbi:MAG: hypothetical protein A2X22_10760 [Bacteroidetes bacterium GWF2_49_14]|nr:MAG: hypothetical protein A2X22_10760 [Bacteroidetes bacterium GWF2_49_14]HBB91737.1 excinuclease ABC subunit C [Bacteroidales bacterium]
MYTVYILYSASLDRYYIGQTNDLYGRLRRHVQSNQGFTSRGKPWELIYYEVWESRSAACHRELEIKGWKSRDRIIELIQAR